MSGWSADAFRNRRQAQRNLRYRCICGRIIGGNAGWWSHTHLPNGDERDGHGFDGRA